MKKLFTILFSIILVVNLNAQEAIHKYGFQELGLLNVEDSIIHKNYIEKIEEMCWHECQKYNNCDLTGQTHRWMAEYEIARYDDLLNIYFNTLKDMLSVKEDSSFIFLRESQRNWLVLRDNTEKYAWESMYGGRSTFLEDILLQLYKHRTYELYLMIEELKWTLSF